MAAAQPVVTGQCRACGGLGIARAGRRWLGLGQALQRLGLLCHAARGSGQAATDRLGRALRGWGLARGDPRG
ncbi:hypothetical protein ABTK89_19660, partial [Acinetobacter baumannii]